MPKDKYDKPSLVDKALYLVATAQTRRKKRKALKRKKKKAFKTARTADVESRLTHAGVDKAALRRLRGK